MNPSPEITLEAVSAWLTHAVSEVCETMFCQVAFPIEAEDCPVYESISPGETLVTSIGFGGACDVRVAIHLPVSLAERLASRVLEMPAAELDEAMVNDVGGEFGNMVVGAVKSRVSDLGVPCETLPDIQSNRIGFRVGQEVVLMDVVFQSKL